MFLAFDQIKHSLVKQLFGIGFSASTEAAIWSKVLVDSGNLIMEGVSINDYLTLGAQRLACFGWCEVFTKNYLGIFAPLSLLPELSIVEDFSDLLRPYSLYLN